MTAADVAKDGWGWPALARKPHFFRSGEIVSLCGRWMFSGERFRDEGRGSKDDCKPCSEKAHQLGLVIRD